MEYKFIFHDCDFVKRMLRNGYKIFLKIFRPPKKISGIKTFFYPTTMSFI
jgi:hypothetical protein